MKISINSKKKNINYASVGKSHHATKSGILAAAALVAGAQIGYPAINQASAIDESTNFEVNVAESLMVTLTTPTDTPTGDVNTFLRNTVQLAITSNNGAGFTASMYSDGSTDLTNTAETIVAASQDVTTIPTLASSSTRSSFPTNRWGYSLASASLGGNTYGESGTESGAIGTAGNPNSTYYPMVATSASPITILTSSGSTTGSQNIYFGAKADTTKAAGTYAGKVIISVVSGVVQNDDNQPSYNPVTPVNPVTPDNDTTYNDNVATTTTGSRGVGISTASNGSAISGVKVETNTSTSTSNHTSTTETRVTTPLGVTQTTTSSVSSGAPLAAGLAATAGTAAASGLLFFILAKRRDDDDDEEDENPEA